MELQQRTVAAPTDPLEQLIATHEPRVRRLAHRLLGWRHAEVDDVVQDVFVTALTKLNQFRGDADVGTWLAKVTINRCRTHRRRQVFRLRWLRQRMAQQPTEQFEERDETTHLVRQAVRTLRASDRELIVLFYLEQLPGAQIADLLGIGKGALDVRLHRARQRLKEKLENLYE